MLLLLIVLACDPGFVYHPRGWERVERYEWSMRINDIEIRTDIVVGLIGDKSFDPEFKIINNSAERVVIEDAQLLTAERTYPVEFAGNGELRWRSASPGSEARITLGWSFEQYALEVLGDRPKIVLDLRLGEEQHQVEIEYERIQ